MPSSLQHRRPWIATTSADQLAVAFDGKRAITVKLTLKALGGSSARARAENQVSVCRQRIKLRCNAKGLHVTSEEEDRFAELVKSENCWKSVWGCSVLRRRLDRPSALDTPGRVPVGRRRSGGARLKLMFGTMTRAADRWRAIKFAGFGQATAEGRSRPWSAATPCAGSRAIARLGAGHWSSGTSAVRFLMRCARRMRDGVALCGEA
jgi:hypothetical protein